MNVFFSIKYVYINVCGVEKINNNERSISSVIKEQKCRGEKSCNVEMQGTINPLILTQTQM